MQRKWMTAAFGAAVLGASAGAAFAQTGSGQTGSGYTGSGHTGSEPYSRATSNTSGQANRPEVAPSLPTPMVPENADAVAFLHAARAALARGQTGRAQEALERAETRLLDRSVPLFQTDQASYNPAVPLIAQALRVLGLGDREAAMRYIDQAMPLVKAAPPPR